MVPVMTEATTAPAAPRPRRRLWWLGRRLLVRSAKLALVLALVPTLLVPTYLVVRPVSTLMLADLVMLRGFDRRWVPLLEISPNLVRAVMTSEDRHFCAHAGVDWDELVAVLDQADGGGPTRGASTIPMQVVKNLFLWSGRSYARKALEIPLALYADLAWSKWRMLEIYLNVVEWGPGIYGAEAAAQRYFGKPASELDRGEAALMATALPSPLTRNPAQPTERHARLARSLSRRAWVDATCLLHDAR